MIEILHTLQVIAQLLALLSGQLNAPVKEVKFGAIEPVSIVEQIRGKTSREKADIKSEAIKNALSPTLFTKDGFDIEVRSIAKIDRGVEIYARAWKDGKPVGFIDGSVEIERFRIFNPPILVPDPLGGIIRPYTDDKGNIKTLIYREDPLEAIKQTLAHTIKVSAKDGSKIIKGKIGNTTSTFFPDADVESTSVEGMIQVVDVATWEGAQDATTGTANDSAASSVVGTRTDANGTTLRRAYLLFDTSAI